MSSNQQSVQKTRVQIHCSVQCRLMSSMYSVQISTSYIMLALGYIYWSKIYLSEWSAAFIEAAFYR